jgi:hypothetical protein
LTSPLILWVLSFTNYFNRLPANGVTTALHCPIKLLSGYGNAINGLPLILADRRLTGSQVCYPSSIKTVVRLMTIYVGNLSYKANETDLRDVFAEYGEVKRVVVPTDRETGRMRGFAFVELEPGQNEDSAITKLDGAEWMGRELRLNKAKPKPV